MSNQGNHSEEIGVAKVNQLIVFLNSLGKGTIRVLSLLYLVAIAVILYLQANQSLPLKVFNWLEIPSLLVTIFGTIILGILHIIAILYAKAFEFQKIKIRNCYKDLGYYESQALDLSNSVASRGIDSIIEYLILQDCKSNIHMGFYRLLQFVMRGIIYIGPSLLIIAISVLIWIKQGFNVALAPLISGLVVTAVAWSLHLLDTTVSIINHIPKLIHSIYLSIKFHVNNGAMLFQYLFMSRFDFKEDLFKRFGDGLLLVVSISVVTVFGVSFLIGILYPIFYIINRYVYHIISIPWDPMVIMICLSLALSMVITLVILIIVFIGYLRKLVKKNHFVEILALGTKNEKLRIIEKSLNIFDSEQEFEIRIIPLIRLQDDLEVKNAIYRFWRNLRKKEMLEKRYMEQRHAVNRFNLTDSDFEHLVDDISKLE